MILKIKTGWLWWRRERAYEGECTVWHEVETGHRASSVIEARLADIWKRCQGGTILLTFDCSICKELTELELYRDEFMGSMLRLDGPQLGLNCFDRLRRLVCSECSRR